jgi:hypothetical protein
VPYLVARAQQMASAPPATSLATTQAATTPGLAQPAPNALPATEPPKSSGGFGISFDTQGLHIGDTITLSPVILAVIAAGLILFLMPPRGRR